MKGRKEFCRSLDEGISAKTEEIKFMRKTLELIQADCPHDEITYIGNNHRDAIYQCNECLKHLTD